MEEANDEIIPEQDAPVDAEDKNWLYPVFLQAGKSAGRARILSKDILSRVSGQIAKQFVILDLHKGNYVKNLLSADILCYRRIVEMNPESSTAHYNLGMALMDRMKFNQAIVHLEKAVFWNFHHIRAHIGLARVYRKLGRPDKTIEVLEKAIEHNPDSREVKDTLNSLRGQCVP